MRVRTAFVDFAGSSVTLLRNRRRTGRVPGDTNRAKDCLQTEPVSLGPIPTPPPLEEVDGLLHDVESRSRHFAGRAAPPKQGHGRRLTVTWRFPRQSLSGVE